MKSNSISRYLGLGLGVGIASFAIYQGVRNQVPEHFEPTVAEFRPLSDLDSVSGDFQQSLTQGDAVLVQFNSDGSDDNQIVLPTTDEITAGQLKLAPAMGFDALDMSAEVGAKSVDVDKESSTQFDAPVATTPQLESASTTRAQESTTERDSAEDARLFEISGSSWRPNPFLDAENEVEKDAAAHLTEAVEIKSETFVEVERVADSSSFAAAEPQSTQDFSPAAETTVETVTEEANVSQIEIPLAAPNQWEQVNPALMASKQAIASPKMGLNESVLLRATHHIEYGKALTRRGSIYTARQEFYSALRVLAQSNDSMSGTNHYSASLRDGILALKEAEDFMVNDAETRIGLNVSHVIETHQSDLVTADEAQYVNPAEAMQRYFAFAEQQLEIATGNNVVAAEALYCLGKLHTSVAQHKSTSGRLDLAKSIVYHRAALASDQNNHRSANELGVLLARSGQLHDAKDLLKKSLLINPTPQSWQNLTKVHLRLGEKEMAKLAHSEYQLAMQQNAKSGIRFMPAKSFNAAAPIGFHEPVASQAKAEPILRPESKKSDEKPKSLGDRLKDLF